MSLPAGFVQIDLFAVDKEDYEVNENPMVRKYGLTWIGAKCGVSTRKAKPCQYFDRKTGQCLLRNKEHWRMRGEHNRRWDACGMYQPKHTAKCHWCEEEFDQSSKDKVRENNKYFCSSKCFGEWLDFDPKQEE